MSAPTDTNNTNANAAEAAGNLEEIRRHMAQLRLMEEAALRAQEQAEATRRAAEQQEKVRAEMRRMVAMRVRERAEMIPEAPEVETEAGRSVRAERERSSSVEVVAGPSRAEDKGKGRKRSR